MKLQEEKVYEEDKKIFGIYERRKRNRGRGGDFDLWSEISPRIWGVYCVDRVEMCGQILLDIQRKVESVYEVKGKI